MKKIQTRFAVLFIVVFALVTIGCPTRTEIEKAAKWGYDAAEYTREAQHIVTDLYSAGKVSLDHKDRFLDGTKEVFTVLDAYNNEVERQNNLLKSGATTIPEAQAIIQAIIAGKVIGAINTAIVVLNLMDPAKAGKLFAVIRTIVGGLAQVMAVYNVQAPALAQIKS